jgi:hypothetical protein
MTFLALPWRSYFSYSSSNSLPYVSHNLGASFGQNKDHSASAFTPVTHEISPTIQECGPWTSKLTLHEKIWNPQSKKQVSRAEFFFARVLAQVKEIKNIRVPRFSVPKVIVQRAVVCSRVVNEVQWLTLRNFHSSCHLLGSQNERCRWIRAAWGQFRLKCHWYLQCRSQTHESFGNWHQLHQKTWRCERRLSKCHRCLQY